MKTSSHKSVLNNDLPKIKNLYVYPTYAVFIPQRESYIRSQDSLAKANLARLLKKEIEQDNNTGQRKETPVLSKKATRRLINSVNWLVASAKNKTVFDKTTGKNFTFKVNFITLTLPANSKELTDHFFKTVLLHNFINTCRSKYGLVNFVWKVEAQENGNIHAHFTTDTFIHWRELRNVWNRILKKNGLLEDYTDKHSKMSFEDYTRAYQKKRKTSLAVLQKSFNYGVATSWQDPNTTDVHAVHKVSDISAYLAKYMSKSDSARRRIKGRVWSSSYSLSSNNKLVIEVFPQGDEDIIAPLHDQRIKWKPIEIQDNNSGRSKYVGDIFFFKQTDWGLVLKGRLLELYNDFRYKIRAGVTEQPNLLTVFESIISPKNLEIYKSPNFK